MKYCLILEKSIGIFNYWYYTQFNLLRNQLGDVINIPCVHRCNNISYPFTYWYSQSMYMTN